MLFLSDISLSPHHQHHLAVYRVSRLRRRVHACSVGGEGGGGRGCFFRGGIVVCVYCAVLCGKVPIDESSKGYGLLGFAIGFGACGFGCGMYVCVCRLWGNVTLHGRVFFLLRGEFLLLFVLSSLAGQKHAVQHLLLYHRRWLALDTGSNM